MGAPDDVSEQGLVSVGLEVAWEVWLGFVVLWASEVPGVAPQARSPVIETIIVASAMPQRKPVVNCFILQSYARFMAVARSVSLLNGAG